MQSYVVPTLQVAACAAAVDYAIRPKRYSEYYNVIAARTERAFGSLSRGAVYISEHEATKSAFEGVQRAIARIPERYRPAMSERKQEERTVETTNDAVSGATDEPLVPKSFEPDGGGVDTAASITYYPPANYYPPKSEPELSVLSRAELDRVLENVAQRRTYRQQERRRIQRYLSGEDDFSDKSSRKKVKKTVRFTSDTKPGSAPAISTTASTITTKDDSDKLLSPLPPPPDTELTAFSASLAGGNGSLFTHSNDFNEADLIRRLPAQMKNGAGGVAWCRGRTEQGLYLLDTPVKRLLLDLRAGVCYDGANGSVLSVDQTMYCVLWGREKVEERWGGFGWRRGLEK